MSKTSAARLWPCGTPLPGFSASSCPSAVTIQVEVPHARSRSTMAGGRPACARIDGYACKYAATD
eukprot:38729-Amphidinium_carterae.1